MNKVSFSAVLLISISLLGAQYDRPGKSHIEKARHLWKAVFIDVEPERQADSWMVPFMTKDRFKLKTIKVVSVFGAYRSSYLKGHIHTAVDLVPAEPSKYNYVYAMANGVICSIHLTHPHKTIVVKHMLQDGATVYTSYKHLQEVYVKPGMNVDQSTKLARLYTHEEAKKQGGNYDHLHLEIRKSVDDYGCASWLTMTKEELNEYFYNPIEFMKRKLGPASRVQLPAPNQ